MLANNDFLSAQSARGVLHKRERLGQDFVQAALQFFIVLDFRKFLFPGDGFLTKRFVWELLQSDLDLVDFGNERADFLYFTVVLRADEFLYDKTDHGSLKWCQTLRERSQGVKDFRIVILTGE